jgi:hypothetical protein
MLQEIVGGYGIKEAVFEWNGLAKQVRTSDCGTDNTERGLDVNAEKISGAVRIARLRAAAQIEMALVHQWLCS